MSPAPVRARSRRAVAAGAAVRRGQATAAAVAPQRRDGEGRRADVPARPKLRLVDDASLQAARRRRRTRRLVVVGGIVGCLSLFALAGAHALLVSGQVRLDRLEEEVGEEQARYESLRLEVAELESPGRIVAEAQTRLGMVPPPSIIYLTPTGPSTPPSSPAEPPGEQPSGSQGSWAAIKPYLGERP